MLRGQSVVFSRVEEGLWSDSDAGGIEQLEMRRYNTIQ